MALLKHELIIFQEERSLSHFIGDKISSQLHSTDEIFSSSEVNIFHCIQDFIDLAEPAVKRYRDRCRNSLSKHDSERYQRAFHEFRKLYHSSGEDILKGQDEHAD